MKKEYSFHSPYVIAGFSVLGLLFLASTWFFVKATLLLQENVPVMSDNILTSEDVLEEQYLSNSVEYEDPLITVVPEDKRSAFSKTKVFVSSLDPFIGSTDAKVYVIIFGSYMDKDAERYILQANDLVAEYGNDLAVVWKDFVSSDDERAVTMATFAHCADEQYKYSEYINALANRSTDDDAILYKLADEVGLDRYTMEDCVTSSGYAGVIQQSHYVSEKQAVSNSHTVFINDEMYSDALSNEELRAKITNILEQY